MKVFICFGLLLLTVLSQGRVSIFDEYDENEFFEGFQESIQEKCQKTGVEFSKEKFDKAIETSKSCLKSFVPNDKEEFNVLQNNSLLHDLCLKKPNIRKCVEDLLYVMEDCCAHEEKYLPDFMFRAFDGLSDLICKNDGEIFYKIFNNNTLDCISEVFDHIDKVETCGNYKLFTSHLPDDFLVKKGDLCHDLSEAKICLSGVTTELCKEENDVNDIISGLYKALASPCN